MQIMFSEKKKAAIAQDMTGLFFEDINYAADGGLYAEMIENRNFEFLDCYGDKADYYTIYDGGYGWRLYPQTDAAKMRYVTGSPVAAENPHYLRFCAGQANLGFANKAYDGIALAKGGSYLVKFYARSCDYAGAVTVSVQKEGRVIAAETVSLKTGSAREEKGWVKYGVTLRAEEEVRGADFVMTLKSAGTVEFDFISMMPKDALAGIFRRDLVELLAELKPGFIRFPGGCIVEGNTLLNRYDFKETLKAPERRRVNWNRWAVHNNKPENDFHGTFSHYNQTLGLGYYEYFLLCELVGAKPLPVLNVGLACQYQSFERVEPESEEFKAYIKDALDLIEFANGPVTSKWGAVRKEMGHEASFELELLGIGNEQWETQDARFFERYTRFEQAIHDVYPGIKLIGSAGPDITSDKYTAAWEFYRKKCAENETFAFAVDEHYYVKPEWFYANTHFYDDYPRDVKVFAGEYAAHTDAECAVSRKNTLGAALSEAAFLTGVERNADVVVLASYAPLFARDGYVQWAPDMIWFDDVRAYATPSYYVQKLYSHYKGTVTLDTLGGERTLEAEHVFYNVVLDEAEDLIYCKIVNANGYAVEAELSGGCGTRRILWALVLGGGEKDDCNSLESPQKTVIRKQTDFAGNKITLEKNSFTVICLS